MKKKPLTLSSRRKPNQQDQFKFLAKDNNILLTSDDHRRLLIDMTSGTIQIMPDFEDGVCNSTVTTCFDPRFSVLWNIVQVSGMEKFVIKYNKSNIFKSDGDISKIDPLIDLSDDLNFPSQRYRIALNVLGNTNLLFEHKIYDNYTSLIPIFLVNTEKLLLKKCVDQQANMNQKTKQLNREIFTVKRYPSKKISFVEIG